MKILHIAASLSSVSGGPPKVIQGLTETLVKKGNEVSIFASAKERDGDNLIYPKGTKVRIFKESFISKTWKGHSFYFKKALEKEVPNFNIVHIHETWHYLHFVAYRMAKKFKKPFIITPYGTLEPWCLNYKGFKKKVFSFLIQRRILKEASAIHAITENEAKNIKAFGVNNTPIAVIPNGIDLQEFRNLPPKEALLSFIPKLKGKKIILFLGRIHPIKGLDLLIKAFSKIAKQRKNICLLVVGPDEDGYQAKIENLLEKEGILDRVFFTGMLTGYKKLVVLGGSDICIIPSYSEARSIVALEAMLSGLPVIITHQCNFPEIAENKAGLIINPKEDELTEAITKLLENPSFIKEMGENGQGLVREKFAWDNVADQTLDLYKMAIRGKIIKQT